MPSSGPEVIAIACSWWSSDVPSSDPQSAKQGAYDGTARQEEAPAGMPETPPCTFCGGSETEMMNAFGSQLSVASYWCRACRSPFEFMKWRG